MDIEEVKTIKLSTELLSYFSMFNDFEYIYIPSIIESIKNEYKIISLENISQILYLHKISSFLVSYIEEISTSNLQERLCDLVRKEYSGFLYNNDRALEVNSMIYLYKNENIKIVDPFKFTLSNFSIHLSVNNSNNKNSNISIDKKLFLYGLNSFGRLDIYVKSHILNQVIYLNFNSIKNDLSKEFLDSLNNMDKDISRTILYAESNKLTEEKYLKYLEIFVDEKNYNPSYLRDLNRLFYIYQKVSDQYSLKICEKLFIQLLGHKEKEIRDKSVKLLNMLYDETNLQEKEAFKDVSINMVGDDFKLELIIRENDFDIKSMILLLSCPSYNEKVPYNIISWNLINTSKLINDKNVNYYKITINLKEFTRCGYYDWNLIKFSAGRISTVKIIKSLSNPSELWDGLGRFIVLEKSIKDMTIHEVFTDLLDAKIDKEKGNLIKRGDFSTLENKLEEFSQRDINCLYIMGALERDNEITIDDQSNEIIQIGNSDCSPMAVICRSTISNLLGGDKAFRSLIDKANKFSMKIIIDSLARISSSKFHRKVLLHFLDDKGKINLCYGTDGISTSFDDTALLNYRKVESWDLLVDDILNLALRYDIDGVHLDNCQAWPQIMKINYSEMKRLDSDLKPAYSIQEIMDGEVVYRDEDCGYWESEISNEYPNPMLIKITKKLWKFCPKFIIIGECWMTSKFVNRHINLAKSGIIPRLYTLPRTLSSVYGKKIHKTGHIDIATPVDVNIFREWIEENNKNVPQGTIFIQSSCGLMWPYPSLLYGRGNWAAVDLLFTLPDVPLTFMGEIEGESFRVQITNLYVKRDVPKSTPISKIKRSRSLISMDFEEEENHFETKSVGSERIEKVKSLVNVSAITLQDIKKIKEKQDNLIKEIGPEFGFDLTKIKFHYDHRMKIRKKHESLRRGKLVYLNAYDNHNKPHSNVFVFARCSQEETGIIAINFKNTISHFELDLKNLINMYDKTNLSFNSMCYIEDWVLEEKGDYYFFIEVISEGYMRTLNPFSSMIFGIQLIDTTDENFKFTLEKSISRMINIIKEGNFTDNCRLSIQLKYILENQYNLDEFILWYSFVLDTLSKYDIDVFSYINRIKFIKENSSLATIFFQYCNEIIKNGNHIKIRDSVEFIIQSNNLGPIVFVTPELGRWSTIGGLGVMVDELTQGLKSIGQDIIVITPYYERNRKGETGYLSRDPAGFKYIGNIDIQLDAKVTFGIHHGIVNGVKIYFLHNYDIFPTPYADGNCSFILKQISYFSKAALQCCCFLRIVPSILLTNDWSTGLVAAYSKNGHFGETFIGTTFFHIAHNLETNYEGRLFPSPNEGTLDFIYKLPSHLLVDPFWHKKVINPSRCAILSSDQWGTVSPSYKRELLENSSLKSLLKSFSQAFAFPNGILKKQRIKNLEEKVGSNHLEAKAILQKKYFKFQSLDDNVPVFAFVGRITEQKGVILILDAAEAIINKYKGKINILVGGMGNPKDPYCNNCINKINYLNHKFPHNFWANPYEFFTDGPAVNVGADFGLMPSLFEPGGIVQHEFFIGGTPVLAFKTGGLRDTVFEFDNFTERGNGISFESHNIYDLMWAFERSYNLFTDKAKYQICRKNASMSAIDVVDVARAWLKEFYRLRNKIFFHYDEIKNFHIFDNPNKQENKVLKQEILKFDINCSSNPDNNDIKENRVPITFCYKGLEKSKPSSVQICGSFEKWQVRHPLIYNPLQNKWTVTLRIKKGIYNYKYIVDGVWVTSELEKTIKDCNGFINNVISL